VVRYFVVARSAANASLDLSGSREARCRGSRERRRASIPKFGLTRSAHAEPRVTLTYIGRATP
jgi:hypothetical protein